MLFAYLIACGGNDAVLTVRMEEPEAGPYDVETPCTWSEVATAPGWERYDCNPLQESGAWTASFGWVEGEGFYTWQVRGEPFATWELVYSSSTNGVEWVDWQTLLNAPAGEWDSLMWDTLAVRPYEDEWLMTYQGIGENWSFGIGLIESPDGITWEHGDSIVRSGSACWPVEVMSPSEVYITKGSMFDARCDLYKVLRDEAGQWATESEPTRVSEGMGFVDWGLIKDHEYAIEFAGQEANPDGSLHSVGHHIEWDGEPLDFGMSDQVASFEAIEIGPHIYVWVQDEGQTFYFRLLGDIDA